MKRICLVGLIVCNLFIGAAPAAALSKKAVPAKAAVVIDSSGEVLYSKFPNARLAPASTVKLVTAMVVLDMLDSGKTVKVSPEASKVRSIQPRLCPEDEFTVSDLLRLALMKSINGAAVALAEAAAGSEDAFAALMNRKAELIGANNTRFANASGLPKGVQYTTASDLVLILKAALSYPLIREVLGTKACIISSANGRQIFLENSNDLLWQEQNMIGGKTGYTGNARHCFVGAVSTDKGPLFTAVLGARSRSSLWRSLLMLDGMGVNLEQASLAQKSGGAGESNDQGMHDAATPAVSP